MFALSVARAPIRRLYETNALRETQVPSVHEPRSDPEPGPQRATSSWIGSSRLSRRPIQLDAIAAPKPAAASVVCFVGSPPGSPPSRNPRSWFSE